MKRLKARAIRRIDEVGATQWNALAGSRYPHLRHEFLHALERYDCLGEKVGWLPCHLIFEDAGQLVAAMPMYLKFNSFGEFVFDWSWEDAFQRAGLNYFPKLVISTPFTPATGPRILVLPGYDDPALMTTYIETAVAYAHALGVSSCHWLFTTDRALLNTPLLLARQGFQFHWRNQGYSDFGHYLSHLTSKRRKQINKERREVHMAGISFRRVRGSELGDGEWMIFHRLYQNTFHRHGNYPALTLEFFKALGRSMGGQVMVIFAQKKMEIIAASFFLVGADTLYGRYWGCFGEIPGLHFEACYYLGLEYCIEQGLERFEPGAQGEHKISRGFLPTPTWSAHWISDPKLRHTIGSLIARETPAVRRYMAELSEHSPFKIPPPVGYQTACDFF